MTKDEFVKQMGESGKCVLWSPWIIYMTNLLSRALDEGGVFSKHDGYEKAVVDHSGLERR